METCYSLTLIGPVSGREQMKIKCCLTRIKWLVDTYGDHFKETDQEPFGDTDKHQHCGIYPCLCRRKTDKREG